jgi:lipoprotein signal peptidase
MKTTILFVKIDFFFQYFLFRHFVFDKIPESPNIKNIIHHNNTGYNFSYQALNAIVYKLKKKEWGLKIFLTKFQLI